MVDFVLLQSPLAHDPDAVVVRRKCVLTESCSEFLNIIITYYQSRLLPKQRTQSSFGTLPALRAVPVRASPSRKTLVSISIFLNMKAHSALDFFWHQGT